MERHLLIAGFGRAGTTLFYNMLRHTLRGFTLPEGEAAARPLLAQPGNLCTKRPFDIFDVPRILQAAQGRKRVDLIVSLRDPRDILTSFHRAMPDDYFCGADHCWFVPKGQVPKYTAPGLLPIWKAITTISASGIFPQGIFFLKYEDLVADPEAVKAMLARDLDLDFEGNFSDFHTAAIPEALQGPLNGVRPVARSETPRWQRPEHRARLIDQFTRFPELHEVLFRLGYEDDRSWFDRLRASAA